MLREAGRGDRDFHTAEGIGMLLGLWMLCHMQAWVDRVTPETQLNDREGPLVPHIVCTCSPKSVTCSPKSVTCSHKPVALLPSTWRCRGRRGRPSPPMALPGSMAVRPPGKWPSNQEGVHSHVGSVRERQLRWTRGGYQREVDKGRWRAPR